MVSVESSLSGYRRFSRKFIIVGFSMALFASFCVILVLCIQIGVYSRELNRIKETDWSRSKEIEDMRLRISSMETEINDLVRSRLPRLKELAIDKVIAVDRHYVKNIVFTLTGKNGHRRFEYKTVLENKGANAIEPKARVIFFDRLGIQIGQAVIDESQPGSAKGLLEPGEVRSYYNHVQFTESQIPRYFKIDIEVPESV